MLQRLRKPLFATLFLTLLAAFGWADDRGYDELRDEQGRVRPAYQKVLPIYEGLGKERQEQFLQLAKDDFQGDNALDALPRMISRTEFVTLRKGVEQRGLAIRKFLEDYYAGKSSNYEDVIPHEVARRIAGRTAELAYEGQVDPRTISFPYGPDIIRDSQGNWRVIEDNPGYIGGPGDLIHARKVLQERIPEYDGKLNSVDKPEDFYDKLIERYRKLARPPGARVVFYLVPPFPDHEDDRLIQLYKERGIDVVTPHTRATLKTTEDGVHLLKWNEKPSAANRVGYVIMNGEHAWIDNTHPASYERALVDEARGHLEEKKLLPAARKALEKAVVPEPATGRYDHQALEKAINRSNYRNDLLITRYFQAKGLTEAILKGKVASNYSPGVDFIGDKEFYVYVEGLIRKYLKEEPILQNIPTERFSLAHAGADGKPGVDTALMERVFSNPKDYVVKAVDGRGGNAVWVGAKLPEADFQAVREKILADPDRFIVQKYTPLSLMDGKIVDIRMISAVDPKGVFVSNTPWGRALPVDGDGKVNLSASGREVAVVVTRAGKGKSKKCDFAYSELAN